MRLGRAVVIGCVLPFLASCTTAAPRSTGTGPTYTCCETADIDRDYVPGQTLTIHWIVTPGEPGTGGPTHQIELSARLTGPYATASDLKAAVDNNAGLGGAATFTAEPVRPSGRPGQRPVSVIAIPSTAAPGYYNLVTSVTDVGGTSSGGSVIRVISKT